MGRTVSTEAISTCVPGRGGTDDRVGLADQVTARSRYDEAEIAAHHAAGWWSHQSLAELIAERATASPERTFAVDDTTVLSYWELAEQSRRLARALHALGIDPGDRVIVQLPNWCEFFVAFAALGTIGAVVVPAMPVYRRNEMTGLVDQCAARAAITCDRFRGFDHLAMFQSVRHERPGLEHLVVVRGGHDDARAGQSGSTSAPAPVVVARPGSGNDGRGSSATSRIVHRFEELVVSGAPDVAEPATGVGDPDTGSVIVYTSGTTSRSKGCYHTLNTMRASAMAIALSLRYTERDIQFGPSPITHSTGLINSILVPLLTGGSTYVMEMWDPERALGRIAELGCTATVAPTAFLQMIMDAYDPARHDMSSMRVWGCAASVIPPAVVRDASALFPGCRILSLYGRSENFLTTICTLDDAPERSLTSDGAPVAGASVRVVDDTGREVPRGEPGDIAYKGPSHMLQYFRDPEQTALLFTPDGYSRSGDLGTMDADGYVRVIGRLKDIVIRGGMNISSREIEELLVSHPGVHAVAVVGMPDHRLGEKVCAYVVPAPGLPAPTLDDLTAHLRAVGIATQKLPERLELIDDLPLSATGKVQKERLRQDIAEKLAGGR